MDQRPFFTILAILGMVMLRNVGEKRSWLDHVGADFRSEHVGQTVRQHVETSFRRSVGNLGLGRLRRCDGADVDDRTACSGCHVLGHESRQAEWPFEVHVNDLVEQTLADRDYTSTLGLQGFIGQRVLLGHR